MKGGAAPKAVLLAAGKSTRISQVSGKLPKVLLEIGGEPVLIHNLKLLSRHGVKEVWINVHYRPDIIRSAAGNGEKWGLKIEYSHEKEILGTAGAVKKLEREFLGSDFFVLYGDNFTDCDLTELMKSHKKSGALGTLALFDPSKAKNSGIAGGKVLVDAQGRIQEFIEGNTSYSGDANFVNAGIYVFDPSILGEIPKGFSDFGKDIFPALLAKKKKFSSYLHSGYCYGIDTPETYAHARGSIQ